MTISDVASPDSAPPDSARPDAVVVGIFHPAAWYGAPAEFQAQLQALRDLDPRVEVITEDYLDPNGRQAGTRTDSGGDPAPAVTMSAAQGAAFGRAEVALALDLPDHLAEVAPRLRWVQAIGAGVDHLEARVSGTGIRLTTNGGSNSIGIAEFVMTRILEQYKPLADIDEMQRSHRWEPRYGRQLAGASIALLGFGPINQAVAARAAAFGLRITVVRRTAGPAPDGIHAVVGFDSLMSVLADNEIVVSALPETATTTGMIGAAQFAAMRPGSFFCNVGRGSLLDEAALIDALASGHLGGAAIDVAKAEPLPPDDPLWDAPRLKISAHCSVVPAAMFPEVHRLFRENLRRYLDGRPLASEVEIGTAPAAPAGHDD